MFFLDFYCYKNLIHLVQHTTILNRKTYKGPSMKVNLLSFSCFGCQVSLRLFHNFPVSYIRKELIKTLLKTTKLLLNMTKYLWKKISAVNFKGAELWKIKNPVASSLHLLFGYFLSFI